MNREIGFSSDFFSPSVNLLDQDRLRHHMDSFTSYIFRQAYEKVNRKGTDSPRSNQPSTGSGSDPSSRQCTATTPREADDPTPTRR